jgi:hypothetical protein
MITFTHSLKGIKNANLVCYISSQKELSQLDFLKLDAYILKDIKKHVGDNKSSIQEYFI